MNPTSEPSRIKSTTLCIYFQNMLLLRAYIFLVYTVSIAITGFMCLESSSCFWSVVLATSMFNFLLYAVVTTIINIMKLVPFDAERFEGKTLVMDVANVSRFRKNVKFEQHGIRIIEATPEHYSLRDGKSVLFYAFDTPSQVEEAKLD